MTRAIVPDFVFWTWLEGWRPVIATTVQDDKLFLRAPEGGPGGDRTSAIVRAVAQQWFGKLVTPADWSHLWLSDGIANFLAQAYEEVVRGADDAAEPREWALMSACAADREARRPLVFDRWQYGPMELLATKNRLSAGI